MWRSILMLSVLVFGTAHAQELTLFAGGLKESSTNERSPAWSFEYLHPLNENIAASFSWLNEGHVPGHHRDGQSIQIWGRANVLDRRLSLAAGFGPYRYFDTTVSSSGASYADIHGWGTVASLSATWYNNSRWLYEVRFDRVVARDSINTNALMVGIGYQLEPVGERGPTGLHGAPIRNTTLLGAGYRF